RVAESIRAAVQAMVVDGWTDTHGPLTASVGCARVRQGASLEDALRDADGALYTAKHDGRNRVVFSDCQRPGAAFPGHEADA
ncbi:MAG: diguanylate cyclase, partial [Alcanivorax sp.]|nr:diguanylate cyclase [Alcanivorax sp.]